MTDRTRNIFVGITTILGLAGLSLMLLMFGTFAAIQSAGYQVTVKLPSAAGLHDGSRVRLCGIDVGFVKKIRLNPPPDRGVTANVHINQEVDLPEGTSAIVASGIFGGNSVLDIVIPDPTPADDAANNGNGNGNGKNNHAATLPATTQPEKNKTVALAAAPLKLLPKDGSATIEGQSASMMAAVSKELRAALAGPLNNFDKLSGDYRILAQKWSEVADNISQLTTQRSPTQVDASNGTLLGNVATVLARADKRLAEMQDTITGLNKWVADEKLRTDIQETAANAKDASGQIKADMDRLSKKYIAVADDLSQAVTSMRATIDQARKGEGTVGKLINDPALYNNLNDASQRLNKTLDEMKLLIEKYKAEGVPVHF